MLVTSWCRVSFVYLLDTSWTTPMTSAHLRPFWQAPTMESGKLYLQDLKQYSIHFKIYLMVTPVRVWIHYDFSSVSDCVKSSVMLQCIQAGGTCCISSIIIMLPAAPAYMRPTIVIKNIDGITCRYIFVELPLFYVSNLLLLFNFSHHTGSVQEYDLCVIFIAHSSYHLSGGVNFVRCCTDLENNNVKYLYQGTLNEFWIFR